MNVGKIDSSTKTLKGKMTEFHGLGQNGNLVATT